MTEYEKIQSAIEYLSAKREQQSRLPVLASHLGLSEPQLQKLFLSWAGLTPEQFSQALSLEDAEKRLTNGDAVLQAASAVSSNIGSCLSGHFVQMDAVSPSEFTRMCALEEFEWGCVNTPFGDALLIFSKRGLSQLTFIDGVDVIGVCEAFEKKWPKARLKQNERQAQLLSDAVFSNFLKSDSKSKPIKLCVTGTAFQVAVWRVLLSIPRGVICSYSGLAKAVQKPRAVRAVASAVGANPIACLIPCHRVLRQSGELGGYRWGLPRKQALLLKER